MSECKHWYTITMHFAQDVPITRCCHCDEVLSGPKPDPYAPKPPPKLTLDMLVTEARCVCCKADLARGTLVRMKPINKYAFKTQCGPCAAREWLPLWDEYQARKK